jgi:hypothetical protein
VFVLKYTWWTVLLNYCQVSNCPTGLSMAGVVRPKLKCQSPKCNLNLFYYYSLFPCFIPSVRLIPFISILAKLSIQFRTHCFSVTLMTSDHVLLTSLVSTVTWPEVYPMFAIVVHFRHHTKWYILYHKDQFWGHCFSVLSQKTCLLRSNIQVAFFISTTPKYIGKLNPILTVGYSSQV